MLLNGWRLRPYVAVLSATCGIQFGNRIATVGVAPRDLQTETDFRMYLSLHAWDAYSRRYMIYQLIHVIGLKEGLYDEFRACTYNTMNDKVNHVVY